MARTNKLKIFCIILLVVSILPFALSGQLVKNAAGAAGATGNANPGGNNTNYQINNSGSFGGVVPPFSVLSVTATPYLAPNNGSSDATTAVHSACTDAKALGATLFFGPGTFLIDTSALADCFNTSGMIIAGANSQLTILKSKSGGSVIAPSGGTVNYLSIRDIHIDGNAGSGNGIDLSGLTAVAGTKISNVVIDNIAGKCIYMPIGGGNSFGLDIDHVNCKSTGDNGIEVRGGPGSIIQNSYIHNIGTNKIGYVCYSQCTFLSDNGLDANTGGTWAQIGKASPTNFGQATFINCNIEFFGAIGVEVVNGWASFINTAINSNMAGVTVQAIRYDGPLGIYNFGVSSFDAQSSILLSGAGSTWLNGVAIHSAFTSCPTILMYNNANAYTGSCYAEGISGSYNLPQMSQTIVEFETNALAISKVYTPDGYFQHQTAIGTVPTINGSFPFCTGDTITGSHDGAGKVTVGNSAPCTQTAQIVFAGSPAYAGANVTCNVHNETALEFSNVNIAAASAGSSAVTWVSGNNFNTGWPAGMPLIIVAGGGIGIDQTQIVSVITDNHHISITPGYASPLTGVSLQTPARDTQLRWKATTTNLTIYNTVNFTLGDVIKYSCTGF